jgi:hypothetical protein
MTISGVGLWWKLAIGAFKLKKEPSWHQEENTFREISMSDYFAAHDYNMRNTQ